MTHRLKRARELAGLTRGQAAVLSVDVIDAELADEEPDAKVMARAAQVYDVSPCWLAGHDGQVLPDDVVKALADAESDATTRGSAAELVTSMASCATCKT